ncbi:5'-nucleotidase C-terminal domain-containing protein [Terrabacter aerolatus]|uniref:Multifunctional 2',3'-cyclic-nucleotide 2'-phosphodiesterase/5'-nucleotidase/3'-nucleotidase n=1 Tax=Terrabacter aerolatus TaxID=422442 RepID=A0A512CYC0_9MICO|nr:5'-nucleotidase C-terminal domain-containing protein [Terrabacter aerolatus]GEO29223.1 multifunctional 2',3'-cyclic-nucleotide 2'-phosphodiesterase/5'-nucleotidase/3'-nucleotidase [Terrabacter aerolatus]
MSNEHTSTSPDLLGSSTTRRQLLALAAVGGAGLAAVGTASTAAAVQAAPGPGTNGEVVRLTVLGTTDLHGNVYNWDYFKNAEYDDKAHNDIGVAKASSIIKAIRAEVGAERTLTIDAGDTIQGTPLAYYYAKIDPITGGSTHPMAAAMNQVGYDAAALGNHEYNYGLDTLRAFEKQLRFPLLSANSVDWNTGAPAFKPWVIKTVKLPDTKAIKVGILGLVTPGVAIWDKANVEGKVKFPGIVEQAKVMVPRLKAAGADVVIVACHSGDSGKSSWGDSLPYVENASAILAQEVPGIDAVLVGHAHLEIPQRYVTNTATGKQVLLSEPYYWGMRVTRMSIDVQKIRGQWQVVHSEATLYNANVAPEDPAVTGAVAAAHQKVLSYVNGVIGTCTQAMSAATSRYEDTAAIDFINYVQADAVKKAIAGTPEASLPVLSIAAPFNKLAAIPAGQVTIRDVAGLYIYDNTLLGIVLTGAQVKAYLEKSAEYFQPCTSTGPVAADSVTNANATPDYNYDVMGGLDADLTYDIDLARPVGSRIVGLAYAGTPVASDARFVVAINNYRQSGGGNFPGVVTAPVVYNRQIEIRQLLIDWATANKVIDPTTFASIDWRLVSNGSPITVTP